MKLKIRIDMLNDDERVINTLHHHASYDWDRDMSIPVWREMTVYTLHTLLKNREVMDKFHEDCILNYKAIIEKEYPNATN